MARGIVPLEEEWKPVVGFEDRYVVSSIGNVASVARLMINHDKDGKTYTQFKKRRTLKAHNDGHGYMHIRLFKNNRVYNKKAHRLVAEAFIPNPKLLSQVNHKNGNKHDNRVENLEWVSPSFNCLHAAYTLCNTKPSPKPVLCIETGVVYKSCMDAQRKTGINNSAISSAARKKYVKRNSGYSYTRRTAGGFHWSYV